MSTRVAVTRRTGSTYAALAPVPNYVPAVTAYLAELRAVGIILRSGDMVDVGHELRCGIFTRDTAICDCRPSLSLRRGLSGQRDGRRDRRELARNPRPTPREAELMAMSHAAVHGIASAASRVKTCPRCRVTKAARRFTLVPEASDGLQTWCKRCMAQFLRIVRRASRCQRGHAFSAENTLRWVDRAGCWHCRCLTCRHRATKARNARRRKASRLARRTAHP